MFKNVLVSLSDKSGLTEFIKPISQSGARIVSTGGTAKFLQEAGMKITPVSEQTGFPEVMSGRVKTLHPKIHMALLARAGHEIDQQTLSDYQVDVFDLVLVNLYPFESDKNIEMIDVGGPSMLRAAAKNYERIVVVCDPSDYSWIQDKKYVLTVDDRKYLAAKVFSKLSSYDSMISEWLDSDLLKKQYFTLAGQKMSDLRYGENPSQKATWHSRIGSRSGLHSAQLLQGKELSYNNLLDLNAALQCVRSFKESPACVAVKHTNPCGVAEGNTLAEAIGKALSADPKSVFGGIIAINNPLDRAGVELLDPIFLECVLAPEVTAEARELLMKRKNLRVLVWPKMMSFDSELEIRSICGGFLIQSNDEIEADWSTDWKIIGEAPTSKEKSDLLFAMKVCGNLKSNAISIVSQAQSLGLGMGQVNRVDAVDQAIQRWKENHPKVTSAVLASDAFFPFADSIEKIAKSGIQFIIQPGGSVRDNEVIAAARANGVHMILTGQRHFKH